MNTSSNNYLTAAEQALLAGHRERVAHEGYVIALKGKILKAAHDFSIWLQRNPEWAHADEEVFFKRFGYMPSPDEEARVVCAGVMMLLAALDAYTA